MTRTVLLPEWASHHEPLKGRIPAVDVNADGMYAAWFAELRAYYAEKTPAEFLGGDGKIKPEWKKCLAELNAEKPTAYWLEVVYQCGKMELQISMRTFTFEIRIHDAGKKFAQKKHASGRGAHRAAGGSNGGAEARDHFKRIRGFIPS